VQIINYEIRNKSFLTNIGGADKRRQQNMEE